MLHLLTPPAEGGIFDFSRLLAKELGENCQLIPLTPESSSEALDADEVLLQFVGYGYSRRGAPLWLLDAVKNHRNRIGWLGVFFHELFAFGPPWTSSFWMCPVQQWISTQLAGLSDGWMTNRGLSERWLERRVAHRPNTTLPVFSTIGVAENLDTPRKPWLVVFGGREVRSRTYQAAGENLFIWTQQHHIEIHDIGPPMEDKRIQQCLLNHGVTIHGCLPASATCELLALAEFGLLDYLTHYVAKSSIFAAYAAHGVCPILISDNYPTVDGLVLGREYLAWANIHIPTIPDSRIVGESARSWYQGHSLEVHVKAIKSLQSAHKDLYVR